MIYSSEGGSFLTEKALQVIDAPALVSRSLIDWSDNDNSGISRKIFIE